MMLRATVHQGSSKFYGHGRQCMTNSVAAILESYCTPVAEWSTSVLDHILERGDQLYKLHSVDGYLILDDLKADVDGFYYSLKFPSIFTGTTMSQQSNNRPYYTLEEALGSIFSESSVCLFTMGASSPCYSTAVLHDDSQYYMFDPHSRNEAGMPTADGLAVLSSHKNLSSLCLFIRHLSALVNQSKNIAFEAASVFAIVDNSNIIADEFDGFSDVSEGELACRCYMLQEDILSDVSSVSSVSSVCSSSSSYCKSIPDFTESVQNLNDSSLLIDSIDIDMFNSFDFNDEQNVTFSPAVSTQEWTNSSGLPHQMGGSLPSASGQEGANSPGLPHQMGESLPSASGQEGDNSPGLPNQMGGSLPSASGHEGTNSPGFPHQIGGSLPSASGQKGSDSSGLPHQMGGSLLYASGQERANSPGLQHQMGGSLPSASGQEEANSPGLPHQMGGSLPSTSGQEGVNSPGLPHQIGSSLPSASGQERANTPGLPPQMGGSLQSVSGQEGADASGLQNQMDGSLPSASAQEEANPSGLPHQMGGSLPSTSGQEGANPPDLPHQMGGSLPSASGQEGANSPALPHQMGGSLPSASGLEGTNSFGLPHQMGGSLPSASAQEGANPPALPHHMDGSLPSASAHEGANQPALPHQMGGSLPSASGSPLNCNSVDDSLNCKRSRKRQRKEETWKRNIKKIRKNSGQSYVTDSGKIKRAKMIKPGCGQKCKKKCHSKVSHDEREKIFHEYWGSSSYTKQKEFICNTVKVSKVKRIHVRDEIHKDRQVSRKYTFIIEGEEVDVCQKFYTDTLDISSSTIASAMHKHAPFTHTSSNDKRGKHTNRPNKVPDSVIQDVKDHIESFPRVESHYCRKSTSKEYLEGGLSLSKMYSLYAAQCNSNNVCPVKESMYRYIFNTQFNISFHKPMKDMCDFCSQYDNMCPEEQAMCKNKYNRHMLNKDKARNAKELAKASAQQDDSYCAACFDLQQVMMLPKANQSCLYYSRKLNNYNLSVYSLGTNNGYCYVWNETVGGRGSCEIATCVFNFLKKMASKNVKSVTTFSDNCTGQNRNRYFLTMLWYSVKALHFQNVSHKFLERGHTENENDSVHSTIERACKNVPVYTTSEWATLMRTARRSKPYIVTEMVSGNFFDFKELSSRVRNLDTDSQGSKIKWMEIKTVTFNSQNPDTAVIQYDYDGPLVYLNVQPRLRNNDRSLPMLKTLFRHTDSPKLSKQKFEDLNKLCKNNTIPEAYHSFYKNLPADK